MDEKARKNRGKRAAEKRLRTGKQGKGKVRGKKKPESKRRPADAAKPPTPSRDLSAPKPPKPALGPPPMPNQDALFVDALADMGSSPQQPTEGAPEKPYLVKAAVALILLLVATGAGLHAFGVFSQGPDYTEVSATPFVAASEVVERATTGTAPTDLILHVNDGWDGVSDKEALLKTWAAEASTQGFSVVNVMGPDGQRVAGSRNNGQTARVY